MASLSGIRSLYFLLFIGMNSVLFTVLTHACVVQEDYVAAILEHEFIISANCLQLPNNTERARCIKLENLDIYGDHILRAKNKGAEIIVFPEMGIFGLLDRDNVGDFAEDIAAPGARWCPCDDPDTFTHYPAQYRFSCMAKSNDMYVVADCVDQKADRSSEENTTMHYYNTAVAYDAEGCLVARYHKENLFGSELETFDRPATTEFSYFDTHFGRVGIFICFDVLFKSPAYDLVEKFNITDAVMPTAWIDALPLYSAVGAHSAWAMGMGVTFLAANFRLPRRGMLGSGIYAPYGPLMWTRNTVESGSILLVTRVRRARTTPQPTNVQSTIENRLSPTADTISAASRFTVSGNSIPSSINTFPSMLFYDEYTFVSLPSGTNLRHVCMNGFCCELDYIARIPEDELYALGVFYGLHTAAQQNLHMQNCVVVKCESMEPSSCGQSVSQAQGHFDYLHLKAENFATKYVFPTVLKSDVQLANIDEYEFKEKTEILSRHGFDAPMLFACLHGRIYDAAEPVNNIVVDIID